MKEHIFPIKENDAQQWYWFERGFSRQELDKIYADVAKIPFQRASVINDDGKVRRSNIKWIPKNPEWAWLYEKLIAMAHEANENLWKFDLIDNELATFCEDGQYLLDECGFGAK